MITTEQMQEAIQGLTIVLLADTEPREWTRETGISYSCLRSRLNTYGWTVSRALETK